ncbi:undecaprenyl diphosphate synthase (plasmid) [Methanohalobium evestigatum Z-7303]|uniref:Tritrans,polycis-undecaprenyl-diphosphate synthase (geranylgeranyl-diphosphate specific) n=1 Tax=Methanohalobium evestigatum (strain ATCC BAA-1072 / DSM 3721 / NBRC 107634 / OCM 161 / Z-7303) TaxID=644295 RepID=D7EBW6_METEZ|nr:polyprenyl diphosphate synthase [Methanohalobium evestigatum]ADI75088.1 undecaprenyl diphosphate synthase [Methanohalobium evestigatum Z-7303]
MLKGILDVVYKSYEYLLTREVEEFPVPKHVAIIMDGNRRYAKNMGKAGYYGHKLGSDTTEKVIEWACEIGIEEMTVYAFSTENFSRPPEETEKLFELIDTRLNEMVEDERTHNRQMKIRAVGDRKRLPQYLQDSIERAEKATCHYENFKLNVALAYGGRQDIIQAVQEIARKVKRGDLTVEKVNESTISNHLYPDCEQPVSDVDMIVRTGGNERVSNFLPWQANGNECTAYFCAPYWPMFRKIDFLRAIRVYQARLTKKKGYGRLSRISHFLKNLYILANSQSD